MTTKSQGATPSAIAKGSRLACDKCKRKVVDIAKAEKSFKFKVDPLVMKETLEIKAIR